jgi:predicted nucleic acid-binding protein
VINLVTDVSVAAKWILRGPEEALVAEARELLVAFAVGRIQLIVPDLFWVELGNVLWKAARVGRCARAVADEGIREMKDRDLLTIPSPPLLEAAMNIALTFNRTVYDSIYVALAARRNAQLITADERLANALAARFPVRWLGSLYT